VPFQTKTVAGILRVPSAFAPIYRHGTRNVARSNETDRITRFSFGFCSVSTYFKGGETKSAHLNNVTKLSGDTPQDLSGNGNTTSGYLP
jgi:hypothetical protein